MRIGQVIRLQNYVSFSETASLSLFLSLSLSIYLYIYIYTVAAIS